MIAEILWRLLVHSAVFGGAILLVAAVVVRLVRQPADQLRVIQWAFVACLVAPCLSESRFGRSLSLNLLDRPSRVETVAAPAPGEYLPIGNESAPSGDMSQPVTYQPRGANDGKRLAAMYEPLPAEPAAKPVSAQPSPVPAAESWALGNLTAWIVGAYLAAVAANLVWWAIGFARRWRLERSARPASAELQALLAGMARPNARPIRLLVSDQIAGPITWGLFRPVIVLPSELTRSLAAPELRWSLAHELSHVENFDFGSLLLGCATQLLCFYQPAYWWLRRRMNLCQDYIADARAAHESGSATDYAEFLVELARARLQPNLPAALGIVERRSQLFRRVRRLLDTENTAARCSRRVAWSSFLGIAALLALLGTVRLDADEPAALQAADAVPPGAPPPPAGFRVKYVELPPTADSVVAAPAPKPAPPATDASTTGFGVVSGVVINAADGKPVDGATVIIHTGGWNRTTSDSEGRFRLEKIRHRTMSYWVWAHRGNLATQTVTVMPAADSTPASPKFDTLRLEMTEGKKARFAITSQAGGQALPGARVRLGYPDQRSVTADEQGIATLEGLLAKRYGITIEADGHARHEFDPDLSQFAGDARYDIALIAGGILRGTVVDEEGKPAAGAEILYRSQNAPSGFFGDESYVRRDGTFRNRFVPLNEKVEVQINKPGSVIQREVVVLTPREREQELKITLPKRAPGGSVAGVVVDGQGKPVAGAKICNCQRFDDMRQTTTDAAGKFVLHDMFPVIRTMGEFEPKPWYPTPPKANDCQLTVEAPGYSPQRLTVESGPPDAPGEVKVTLAPGRTLRGRVVLNGKPAVGALVAVREPIGLSGRTEAITVGADGRFEFNSLAEGTTVYAQLTGHPMIDNLLMPEDPSEPLTISFASAGLIRGRAIDAETGEPIVRFRVDVNHYRNLEALEKKRLTKEEYFREMQKPLPSLSGLATTEGLVFASPTGEFSLAPLSDQQEVTLKFASEGYESTRLPRVVAATPEQVEPLTVKLTRLPPVRKITVKGQLVNHQGQPQPREKIALIVYKEAPREAIRTIPPPQKTPEGATQRPAVVSRFPYVPPQNWDTIAGGFYGRSEACRQFLAGTTDAEGRFEFPNAIAGKFVQIAYWGPTIALGRTPMFDCEQATSSHELTVTTVQPAKLAGTIDRSKFDDAATVRLVLMAPEKKDYDLALEPQQASFEFTNLPPGEYLIAVYKKEVIVSKTPFGMSTKMPVAAQQSLRLGPGESGAVHFAAPNAPQPVVPR